MRSQMSRTFGLVSHENDAAEDEKRSEGPTRTDVLFEKHFGQDGFEHKACGRGGNGKAHRFYLDQGHESEE